jgi:ubiquinone/menaquinone biosynthesis C-methylase UbiE
VSPEVETMRRWLCEQLDVAAGGIVVDLGCGSADDLRLLALVKPHASSYLGIDCSKARIAEARSQSDDHRIEFVCADIAKGLPMGDGSVDAIYSVNLLECLPDKAAFVADCARVLRPGGSILIAHFDWDTQTFDGEDHVLVRKIVHAFSDWQQAWMKDIDPWTGRRLHRYFAGAGSFAGDVRARTLTSSSFEPDSYARRQADSFEALVRNNLISQTEYESFMRFLDEAASRNAFFYSVTMFAFVGVRIG